MTQISSFCDDKIVPEGFGKDNNNISSKQPRNTHLQAKIPPILRNNVLTAEYFLKHDDWTVEQLDAYAHYCKQSLEDPLTLNKVKETRKNFLKQYITLRKKKNERNRSES